RIDWCIPSSSLARLAGRSDYRDAERMTVEICLGPHRAWTAILQLRRRWLEDAGARCSPGRRSAWPDIHQIEVVHEAGARVVSPGLVGVRAGKCSWRLK